LAGLLRDPLIRLVMKSDGVSEQAMVALIDQLRSNLQEREATMKCTMHRRMAPRSRRHRIVRGCQD
jgi:hypothetical protein